MGVRTRNQFLCVVVCQASRDLHVEIIRLEAHSPQSALNRIRDAKEHGAGFRRFFENYAIPSAFFKPILVIADVLGNFISRGFIQTQRRCRRDGREYGL